MSARPFILTACVVSAILLVAGCSSGAKDSALGLGPCPKGYPLATDTYDGINGYQPRLGRRVVPLDALVARVCRYSGMAPGLPLVGSAVLVAKLARQFESDTNRLASRAGGPRPACTNTRFESLTLVTFAAHKTFVGLYDVSCGFVTNGVLYARTTAKWRAEVLTFTTRDAKRTRP